MNKYAFVDRDGTIICEPEKPDGIDSQETFPLSSADQVQFMKNAIKGLQTLVEKGYKLVLVTNQTFLGTDKHPKNVFDRVMDKMLSELKKHEVKFDYVMVCPHGPDDGCNCRKPAIGGLSGLIEENKDNIDFQNSLMFGDRDTDMEFAKNLGVKFIKIETNEKFVLPDYV